MVEDRTTMISFLLPDTVWPSLTDSMLSTCVQVKL
jgi:hypothetical protein